MSDVTNLMKQARRAAEVVAVSTDAQRNDALHAMARALIEYTDVILAANKLDYDRAEQGGMDEGLLDRLALTEQRIRSMADGLIDLAKLPDPLGVVSEDRMLDNGLHISRVSVPLGVVGIVYEARPNVTADAAGICLKSGNAVVLRGGSAAFDSCMTIARILDRAASTVGFPEHTIGMVDSTDRADTDKMLTAHGLLDVIIPRGGAGLIRHCVETATVPVIETGTGNCHVYVNASADKTMALDIISNAKCQRVGVCNAIESVLVDASIASEFIPLLVQRLGTQGVRMHGDDVVIASAQSCDFAVEPATDVDWGTEYLALEISIHAVSGVDEAIDHINRYGTGHSECIVTSDDDAAARFQKRIDAAVVYVNASTRFSDGAQMGMGAEIGISTQKLHVRGPFALEGLTSYKYLINGTGQVRP